MLSRPPHTLPVAAAVTCFAMTSLACAFGSYVPVVALQELGGTIAGGIALSGDRQTLFAWEATDANGMPSHLLKALSANDGEVLAQTPLSGVRALATTPAYDQWFRVLMADGTIESWFRSGSDLVNVGPYAPIPTDFDRNFESRYVCDITSAPDGTFYVSAVDDTDIQTTWIYVHRGADGWSRAIDPVTHEKCARIAHDRDGRVVAMVDQTLSVFVDDGSTVAWDSEVWVALPSEDSHTIDVEALGGIAAVAASDALEHPSRDNDSLLNGILLVDLASGLVTDSVSAGAPTSLAVDAPWDRNERDDEGALWVAGIIDFDAKCPDAAIGPVCTVTAGYWDILSAE